MNLTTPELSIDIKQYEQRKVEYCSFSKKNAYCIDGFAREGANAIIVLPPIFRKKFPFNGIKSAVLVL